MSLDFKRLPLVEVLARYTLAEPLPIGLPFLFDLAETLKPDFSEIEEHFGIEAPGLSQIPAIGQIGGAVLSGPEDGIGLMFGQRVIGVRWQTGADLDHVHEGSELYPRFHDRVLPALKLAVDSVELIIGKGSVKPAIANMVYSNFIEASESDTASEIRRLFRGVLPAPAESAVRLQEFNCSWRQPSGVDLRIHIYSGEGGTPENTHSGLIVKTSGGKHCATPSEAEQNLLTIHDELCTMFEGLLTEEACATFQKL